MRRRRWAAAGAAATGVGVGRLIGRRRAATRAVLERQAHRVERAAPPGNVRLTVVIPAFNEGGRIGDTVSVLRTELKDVAEHGGLEIVVVDDGSLDGTASEAEVAGADQVIAFGRNRGKGAAVRAGVEASTGRAITFTDADLAYSPDHLVDLLREVEAGWDVVVGNRRHVDAVARVRASRLRELGGRGINFLTRLVLVGHYADTQCGLKGFRSDVAADIFGQTRIDGFAFDVEVLHLAERQGCSVVQVPVRVSHSERSTVHVVRDALRLARDLVRIRQLARRGAYAAPR